MHKQKALKTICYLLEFDTINDFPTQKRDKSVVKFLQKHNTCKTDRNAKLNLVAISQRVSSNQDPSDEEE